MAATVVLFVRPLAAADELSPEAVRAAIADGVEFLKKEQREDGSWTDWRGTSQPGGITSLCTLALLNAGVPVEDESIQRALANLRKLRADEVGMTYAVALQTMALCRAEPERDLATIGRNARWLESTQIQEGPTKGSWSYPGDDGDNSNSQFALLALHEAERVGQSIEPRVWRLAKAYWEDCQNPDGSWGYRKSRIGGVGSEPVRGSMTCAGITSLVISNDMVRQSDAAVDGDRIECCRSAESDDDRIQRGLQWLGANFSVTRNPGVQPDFFVFYYLYGLERVGRLTSQRFIGGHDWYREGAAELLRRKGGVAVASGWREATLVMDNAHVSTSFALLFLAKGRRPVLLAKLKHGDNQQWNAHRSDVANLTRFVESRWKRDLTWQVTELDAATIDDLVQSPVLYYAGSDDPLPDSPEAIDRLAKKLRGYIDRGGFLLAEAYCGGEGFDRGFRELMTKVFPEREYRLQLLPPEHPIWRAEMRVDPAHVRPMWGIEFGCRTSVVYCPPDVSGNLRPSLSCLWELSRRRRGQEFSPPVQGAVDAGLATGINVLAYATNRELKTKEMIPSRTEVRSDDGSLHRGAFRIANLRHPGGCNAAPRAVTTLLETAGRELNLRVAPESELLDITDQAIFGYPLVFMQGRNAFSLTPDEQKQLKTYVERGGTLFANSICASRAFTESFRREMATIFPDAPLTPIPAGDPIFSTEYGGYDLTQVTRRDPQPSGEGPLRDLLRKVPPELEAIRFGDRYGVIFSRYDLSCALEKHDSLECQGYIREDAARIALNVVLYCLGR